MITQDLEQAAIKGPRYWKTLHLPQCTRQETCLTITDMAGRILDLGDRDPVLADICRVCTEVDANNPRFPDGIEPKRNWPDVKIVLQAVPSYGRPPVFCIEGTMLAEKLGKVVFHLTEKHTKRAGIFLAEVGLFRGDLLLASWPLYVSIDPSIWNMSYEGDGMVTIPEVRLALHDEMPEDNYLLDDVEFQDYQILACVRQPIDIWNSMLPLDRRYSFNLQNFPYRYPWMRCTCGLLLEIAAHNYRRNDLPVSAGGVTVRDKAKFDSYEAKAQGLIDEFKSWAQNAKASMSLGDAFGTVHSEYARRRNYR